ncbi:MAG: ORF6N domain-containing protein [Candidatus Acidiferrum sp.]
MQMPSQNAIVPTALISQKIFFVRGSRIMLDADLARLYGVATKNLNKAVKRNASRFPSDFMFQLSPKDLQSLRFQTGTSNPVRGGRRYAPYAFTEQGVAMLSSVLRSSRAVQVNVAIMRTFVSLREMLATHEELRRKIDAMEKRYDARFQAVFETIRQMLETPVRVKKAIGFHARLESTAKSVKPPKASLTSTK